MNLKDRGFTIGDLLLLIIFIITTVFIINKIRETEKQAHLYIIPNEISMIDIG